jgi:hypothetical protein
VKALLAVSVVSLLGLVAALFLGSLAPRARVAAGVAAALLLPLILLAVYSALGYRHWRWPLGYDSLIPHAIAALLTAGLMIVVLVKATGRWQAKVLVAFLAVPTWIGLWVWSAFMVACSNGNCL